MTAADWIPGAYVLAFGILLDRKGFQWRWFLPLAGAFLAVTLLTSPGIGMGLLPGSNIPEAGDRQPLLAALMLLIFCPIHAFVSVKVMSRVPKNESGPYRLLVRAIVYLAAALASGFLWTIVMVVIMMLLRGSSLFT